MAGKKMLTRDEILARKTGRGTVDLPSGGTVAIRALTRDECLAVRDAGNLRDGDTLLISFGMVDPALTVEDVAAWAQSDNGGDLVAVSNEISVLSKMAPRSGKEATKSTTG